MTTQIPAVGTDAAAKARKPPNRRKRAAGTRREAMRGWAFISPTLLLVLMLFVVPIGFVLFMSASDWSLLGGFQQANGTENFDKVLSDPMLADAVKFTLKYTLLTTLILMPVSFLLALLVQESRRWNNFLRVAILVPSALGIASASLLFYALYSPQVGPLNGILDKLGIKIGRAHV